MCDSSVRSTVRREERRRPDPPAVLPSAGCQHPGIEATRQLPAAAPDTTVVLLSTNAADDLPADAADCRAAAHLRNQVLAPATLRAIVPS